MISLTVNKNIPIYILAIFFISLSILYPGSLNQPKSIYEYLSFQNDKSDPIGNLIEVKRMIIDALESYRRGEFDKAYEIVSQAYVERYELVEPVLEDIDAELNEELEELIRDRLRDMISKRIDESEIEDLVVEISFKLDEAMIKIKSAGQQLEFEATAAATPEAMGMDVFGSVYVYLIFILVAIIVVLSILLVRSRSS